MTEKRTFVLLRFLIVQRMSLNRVCVRITRHCRVRLSRRTRFPVPPQNSPSRPRRIGEKITTRMAAKIGETERKLIVRPGCRTSAVGRAAYVDVIVSRCSSSQENRTHPVRDWRTFSPTYRVHFSIFKNKHKIKRRSIASVLLASQL